MPPRKFSELPGALQVDAPIHITISTQELWQSFEMPPLQQILSRKAELPVAAPLLAKAKGKPVICRNGDVGQLRYQCGTALARPVQESVEFPGFREVHVGLEPPFVARR